MTAYKDETRNNRHCAFYFEDSTGERKKKMKRGFETKKAAQDWERQFLRQRAADTDMRFDKFVEPYIADRKDRLRENTCWTAIITERSTQTRRRENAFAANTWSSTSGRNGRKAAWSH